MIVAFLEEGTFQGKESRSPTFWGLVAHKRGEGGLTDLELFSGGLGKKGRGQYFRVSGWSWYPGGHYGKV